MDNGIVYLIQPAYLIGLNRYKIGLSKDPNELFKKRYFKDARIIYQLQSNNIYETKKLIIHQLKRRFKLISGYNYFEGNEIYLIHLFTEFEA